jgi:hypothetical protein
MATGEVVCPGEKVPKVASVPKSVGVDGLAPTGAKTNVQSGVPVVPLVVPVVPEVVPVVPPGLGEYVLPLPPQLQMSASKQLTAAN